MVQLIGFADTGQVTVNRIPWVGMASENTRKLSGTGVGLSISRNNFSLKTSYAWKIDPEEKATSDVDRSGMLWIQASAWF